MKFNSNDWSEIKPNVEIQVPAGRVRLRTTAQASCFVTQDGTEALQGIGTEFSFTLSAPSAIKVNIVTPGRVFIRDFVRRGFVDQSEVYTNVDRLPNESGTVLEVTKALRMLKLEERAMVARIRAEMAAAPASDVQVVEPDPEPSEVKE